MKNNKFCNFARAASYNLYEHEVKCPFQALFEGRKYRDKFNFFSEAEPWMRSPKLRRKFTYTCHFNGVEINTKNLKIKMKTRIHFDS